MIEDERDLQLKKLLGRIAAELAQLSRGLEEDDPLRIEASKLLKRLIRNERKREEAEDTIKLLSEVLRQYKAHGFLRNVP